ncbi:MAG: ATP-dependent DNA ligase [Verrucomicrobiota bacterium]
MALFAIRFQHGGVHLPGLSLWLDPHEPQRGPERVFVSHAHSDHIGMHREVILSEVTARLMQARLSGQRVEQVLAFREPKTFAIESLSYQMTLLPAGHIFGSAMAWIEAAGNTLLYTGDFKLRPGLSAEKCEPRPADILIMETTYGRPIYRFPPTAEVLNGVLQFCREALDNDETPVLLGYSLGKSQELLQGLSGGGLPIMLHREVFKLTQIYEQFGQRFPTYEKYDAASAKGKVLICPPNASNSAMLENLGAVRTAILTGWAVDPNCRFRYRTDAAFPLSDHADFTELVELVKRVSPKKIFTLHGFAADFAQTLSRLGFDAQALSEDEQLALPLSVEAQNSAVRFMSTKLEMEAKNPVKKNSSPSSTNDSFRTFAETCSAIAATSKKLEKVRVLSEYVKWLPAPSLSRVATWFTGHPFPSSENKVLQLGWALIRDVLRQVAGVDQDEFHQVYLKHSDAGETAFELWQRKSPAGSELSIADVDALFTKVHTARGPLAKLPFLMESFRRCAAIESKFLVKILTGDLRIGLKEGLVEEAIARAFDATLEDVKQANLLVGNIGETALLAQQRTLASATLVPFRPVKFMLASPEETAADIWKRLLERSSAPLGIEDSSVASSPVLWAEDKYDGIRCQLHKVGNRVALYSRDLKEISATFPEVTDAIRHLSTDLVLDGEILAMRDEEVLPFAILQKRLGRREGDLFLGVEIPIRFVVFDLLWRDGQSFLEKPLHERRQILESTAPWPPAFCLARIIRGKSVGEIETAFSAARDRGNEGLMVKDPASVYSPGRRGLAWLKLKKPLALLDCVVVGAEYGHGKRKAVLSDYTFAVRDESTGELRTIGKAYTGLTDVEIAELTGHFLSRAIHQRGRYLEVEPDIVLEIAFDAIQPSDRHTSGLALRFPRIVRIRPDKSPADIDTVQAAWQFVKKK